jgi:hypothetical protein
MDDAINRLFDLHIADTLCLLDLVLALSDAKLIDKAVIFERWKFTAGRDDLDLEDSIRQAILSKAQGLESAGV